MRMDTGSDERPHRRWTRAEYDQLIELGVLGPEDHVELIEGEILVMSSEGPVHSAEIGVLADLLNGAFDDRVWIRLGNPVVIDDHSEPEPDLLVIKGTPRDFRKRHPSPEEALLVVEVSHSSLSFDLGRKRKLYARARVAEYWVLDLVNECLHVHRSPKGDRFASVKRLEPGDSVRPLRGSADVKISDIFD